jgi:large subunit ribosomal protein L29
MKSSVVREMTTEELQDSLSNAKENLSNMRMQHAVSPLENPMVLKEKRKEVARIQTELTKRSKEAQQ